MLLKEKEQYRLNYIDSLTFGTAFTAFEANLTLQKFNSSEKLRFEEFLLYALQQDEDTLQKMVQESNDYPFVHKMLLLFLSEVRLQQPLPKLLENCEGSFLNFFEKQFYSTKNFVTFRQQKLELSLLYDLKHRPYIPISYSYEGKLCYSKTPVFFMEPYDIDWKKLLKPCKEKSAVFIFSTVAFLKQCLQFDEVVKSLLDPAHCMLVLDLYPHEQLYSQCRIEGELEPVLDNINADLIIELLQKCFKEKTSFFWHESSAADDLYRLGKKQSYDNEVSRLSMNHVFAIDLLQSSREFWECHKGKGTKNITTTDYLGKALELFVPKGKKRKISSKSIAHVVHRLIDVGYAPTQRLMSLLREYDTKKYDVHVIVTEQYVYRFCEYPNYFDVGEKTELRAKKLLEELKHLGIKVYVDGAKESFLKTSENISKYLSKNTIDCAIFHDNSTLNSLIAKRCDVPNCIFYVHGALPRHNVFDNIIMGFENEAKNNELVNPVAFKAQQVPAITKEKMGFEKNAILFTTVSNMLNVRISGEMCQAVSSILKRCPQAYYVPIGALDKSSRIINIFKHYGVEDRVCFLGELYNPVMYLHAMDIYLNEFPEGSGLSIVEALSAGCPVVTMYDLDNTYKSREAGNYFGPEYAIKSCNTEDYINCACNLAQDPVMYKKWSEHAKKRYQEISDTKAYSERHMKIVLDLFSC